MKKHSGALARRYGTALYQSIIESIEKNGADYFENVSRSVRLLLSGLNKKVISFFSNPSLTFEEKKIILSDLLDLIFKVDNSSAPTELKSFLILLIDNDRFSEIIPILNFFLKKSDEFLGITRATIISYRPLAGSELSIFSDELTASLKKKVIMSQEVDASLRSGFVLKIGNVNIDASLRARLNSLKESLN